MQFSIMSSLIDSIVYVWVCSMASPLIGPSFLNPPNLVTAWTKWMVLCGLVNICDKNSDDDVVVSNVKV